jgi:transcriptional regulator with XRE-family HTH domain
MADTRIVRADPRIVRADRRATAMLERIGLELRVSRRAAALTLEQVARYAGLSPSEISRVERGLAPWVGLPDLGRLAGVVGLDLWIRMYPGGEPLRDIAHLRLTDAFRALIGPGLAIRAEVPIGDPRDLRAWDLTLSDSVGSGCGVELETRLTDAQDQVRRLMRKAADGGMDRVLMVVADTRANRIAIKAAASLLSATFAIDDPAAYAALARGDLPPRDALLIVATAKRTPLVLPSHGKKGQQSSG